MGLNAELHGWLFRWKIEYKPKTYPNGSAILIPHSPRYWLCNEQFWSDRGIKPLIFIVWASQKGCCCSGKPFPGACLCQSGHKPTMNPPSVELKWSSVLPDWRKYEDDGGENKGLCGWARGNTEKEKVGCWNLQDCLKKRKAIEDVNPQAADAARQA